MGTSTKKQSTTSITTSTPQVVVLKPAIQKQVANLRNGRDLGKQAKEMSDQARQAILDAVGSITSDLVATDARGKRLLSIKLIPSSAKLDLDKLERENPELYSLLEPYRVAKGAGEPTIRVDVL